MKPITLSIATLLVFAGGCGKKKPETTTGQHDGGSAVVAGDMVSDRGKTARDNATLLVQISLTVGEKGRDSNATQTHISIIDDRIFFTETPHGAFAAKRSRINIGGSLTAEERASLEQSIRDLELLRVESIKTTKLPDGPHSYASLTAKIRLKDKEHAFALSGVTSLPGAGATAFAETAGYVAVSRLVATIGRLARSKDGNPDHEKGNANGPGEPSPSP